MDIAFDRAIELLEITDIGSLTSADIDAICKKARHRWHPDRIAHLGDSAATAQYTANFQSVEISGQLIRAYLDGDLHAGERFTAAPSTDDREPTEVIRENAPEMQHALRSVWTSVRACGFKLSSEKLQLSDGFLLRELLQQDLDDDISFLSIVSLAFGLAAFSIATAIAGAINPVAGGIAVLFTTVFVLACVVAAMPLSRFWMPETMTTIVLGFVNIGLKIFRTAAPDPQGDTQPGVRGFITGLPVLVAKLVKWLLIWPLSKLAKLLVGDKAVGVVWKTQNYYAGAADWYIDELLSKSQVDLDNDELFHLSHLYSELADAPVLTPEELRKATEITEESKRENQRKKVVLHSTLAAGGLALATIAVIAISRHSDHPDVQAVRNTQQDNGPTHNERELPIQTPHRELVDPGVKRQQTQQGQSYPLPVSPPESNATIGEVASEGTRIVPLEAAREKLEAARVAMQKAEREYSDAEKGMPPPSTQRSEPNNSFNGSDATVEIQNFIRAHHNRANLGDLIGFSADYSSLTSVDGKKLRRDEILVDSQKYRRQWSTVSEAVFGDIVIESLNRTQASVRYTMHFANSANDGSTRGGFVDLHLSLERSAEGWLITSSGSMVRDVSETKHVSAEHETRARTPTKDTVPKAASRPGSRRSLEDRTRGLDGL